MVILEGGWSRWPHDMMRWAHELGWAQLKLKDVDFPVCPALTVAGRPFLICIGFGPRIHIHQAIFNFFHQSRFGPIIKGLQVQINPRARPPLVWKPGPKY